MTQSSEPINSNGTPFKDGYCPIWESFPATHELNTDASLDIDSARTGGSYRITQVAAELLEKEWARDASIRNRLTTWLIDQRSDGVSRPEVTPEVIQYVGDRRGLRIAERAGRLLRYLAIQAPEPGHEISFNELDIQTAEFFAGADGLPPHAMSHPTNLGAYAWTEANDWEAVKALLDYLERYSMIAPVAIRRDQLGWHVYTVTVDGYARVEEIYDSVASRQAFVAMWFDASMDEAYEHGIAPAIESAGFACKVINRDPTVDKIDDAIMAEIRRSKFIVADFTHGEDGARGGVYYEAGFAEGLGIPVIFTCHKDTIDDVHFDTRQRNHIVWSDPEELRQRLLERIQARIT